MFGTQSSGRPQLQPPRATSAAEPALGLRPRRALSSAQLAAEWSNSTSPYNDFSANGVYPLISVSHSRGSLQSSGHHLPLAPSSYDSVNRLRLSRVSHVYPNPTLSVRLFVGVKSRLHSLSDCKYQALSLGCDYAVLNCPDGSRGWLSSALGSTSVRCASCSASLPCDKLETL